MRLFYVKQVTDFFIKKNLCANRGGSGVLNIIVIFLTDDDSQSGNDSAGDVVGK